MAKIVQRMFFLEVVSAGTHLIDQIEGQDNNQFNWRNTYDVQGKIEWRFFPRTALVFDGRLWHAAGANQAGRRATGRQSL